jgi:hypothetical protein
MGGAPLPVGRGRACEGCPRSGWQLRDFVAAYTLTMRGVGHLDARGTCTRKVE